MAEMRSVSETSTAVEESTQGQDSQSRRKELEKETKELLNEFNFAKAKKDGENGNLTPEQVQVFEEARRESTNENQAQRNVVERLIELAEIVDREFDETLTEIVDQTTEDSIYEVFRDFVNSLLNCEIRRAVTRLVVLLCYCYRICKKYVTVRNIVVAASVIAITGVVAGYLYKYLCEAKFFDWLEEIGGWSGLPGELVGRVWDRTFGAVSRGVQYVCGGFGVGYGVRAAANRGGRAAARASGEFVDVGQAVRRTSTEVVLFTKESPLFYFRRVTYSAVTSSLRNPVLAVGILSAAGVVAFYSYLREKWR